MYMDSILLRNLAAQLVASPESIDVPRNSIERTKSELESFRIPVSETYHATGADERSSFLKATGWVMLTTSTAYLYKDRMETLGGAFGRQSCRFRPGIVCASRPTSSVRLRPGARRKDSSEPAKRNSPSRGGSLSWRLTAMPRFTTCVRSARSPAAFFREPLRTSRRKPQRR